MSNEYNQLKKELLVLDPGITDLELNNATLNLLSLCKLASQIIEEATSDEVQPAENKK